MIRKIILSLFALASALGASAQGGYLEEIEQNSLTLKALREQMEAEQLANKTGIYLSNPEVEFNYLWGNPSLIGNRTDFSIAQEFDFPTVYKHKSDRAKLLNENAELRYKSERLKILLKAEELIARITHQNGLYELQKKRVENAQKLLSSYQKSAQNGNANSLELNKVKFNFISLRADLTLIESERSALLSQLIQLNGGVEMKIDETSFSVKVLPNNFEEWFEQMQAQNPTLQYLKGEIESSHQKVKVERAMALPRFSAGYMSEQVVGQTFQGVSVGVSVPLWANKNRVKNAKAELIVAETLAEDAKTVFYNSLKSLFERALILQNSMHSINSEESLNLLTKALKGGEMSLITYLQEQDYYYSIEKTQLDANLEYAIILSTLFATEL